MPGASVHTFPCFGNGGKGGNSREVFKCVYKEVLAAVCKHITGQAAAPQPPAPQPAALCVANAELADEENEGEEEQAEESDLDDDAEVNPDDAEVCLI